MPCPVARVMAYHTAHEKLPMGNHHGACRGMHHGTHYEKVDSLDKPWHISCSKPSHLEEAMELWNVPCDTVHDMISPVY